jgi:hypothetical protein
LERSDNVADRATLSRGSSAATAAHATGVWLEAGRHGRLEARRYVGEAAGDGPAPAGKRGTGVSPVGLERPLKNSITRPGALKTNCRNGFMPRFRQTVAA